MSSQRICRDEAPQHHAIASRAQVTRGLRPGRLPRVQVLETPLDHDSCVFLQATRELAVEAGVQHLGRRALAVVARSPDQESPLETELGFGSSDKDLRLGHAAGVSHAELLVAAAIARVAE